MNFGIQRTKPTLSAYIAIARPGHWFKNIFMVPGMALALVLQRQGADSGTVASVLTAFVSTCCIASANYTINEWLDAAFDYHHPVKRLRPSVLGQVSGSLVFLQWVTLSVLGLGLAATLGHMFLVFSLALLLMGVVYNVAPLRTKDRPYFDVLSEAINNPLRFMLAGECRVLGYFLAAADLRSYSASHGPVRRSSSSS